MSVLGYVNAGLQLGYTSSIQKRERGLFDNETSELLLRASVTIEEVHTDELEITDHPVESGAAISDHAFKHPAEVTIRMGWSNSSASSGGLSDAAVGAAAASLPIVREVANLVQTAGMIQSIASGASPDQVNGIYATLLALQEERKLLVVYTGKRNYKDMLIRSIATMTDSKSEDALFITMTLRQVLIVSTRVVTLPSSKAKDGKATGEPVSSGTKTLKPVGGA